jgi:hypothetical protein
MFENIQKNLLEILQLNDLCWKRSFEQINNNNSNSLVANDLTSYFQLSNRKIQETIQQTKFLCETNVRCLAKITALQHEKNELTHSYEERIKVRDLN